MEATIESIVIAVLRTTVWPAVGTVVPSQRLRYFAVRYRLERYHVRPKVSTVLQECPLTVSMSRELGKRVTGGHAICSKHNMNGAGYDALNAEKVSYVPVSHSVRQSKHGNAGVSRWHEHMASSVGRRPRAHPRPVHRSVAYFGGTVRADSMPNRRLFISPTHRHAIWPDIIAISRRIHDIATADRKFYVAVADFPSLHVHGSFKVSLVTKFHKCHARCATATIMLH